MAVDTALKDAIQAAYRKTLQGRSLRPRSSQRQMIAAIANYLSDIQSDGEGKRLSPPAACVIEAGTGTGKTLAYLLGTLPFARALNKKIVLTTATITLQQQIIEQELPQLRAHSGLEFTAALAKGRGRYLCLHKLDLHLQSPEPGQGLDLWAAAAEETGDAAGSGSAADPDQYLQLLQRFSAGWDGDLDHLDVPVEESLWRSVTVDHRQCVGRNCSYIQQCPFFKRRAEQEQADLIVANHDLMLADLALGGGIVLPPPEETLYVIDEAHHLPDKTLQHFSAQAAFGACRVTLNQLSRQAVECQSLSQYDSDVVAMTLDLTPHIQQYHERLNDLQPRLEGLSEWRLDSDGQGQILRFEGGVLPEPLREVFVAMLPVAQRVTSVHQKLLDRVKALSDDRQLGLQGDPRWMRHQVALATLARPLEGMLQLWQAMAAVQQAAHRPLARWLRRPEDRPEEDLRLYASPTDASGYLARVLWQRAHAAVLVSATLSLAGDFGYFRLRTGIPEDSRCFSYPSPFDYPHQGLLRLVDMQCDPGDSPEYYTVLAEHLAQLIDPEEGTLVLFSARRHLRETARRLQERRPDWPLRVQDGSNRAQIVQSHREEVAQGKGSCLMGLASFAEGLDLPGRLLTHVIITRLPFSVPDEPIEATLSEWLKAQGHNPFFELSLPAASIRLVQACGRLLRSESDTGTITLLDRRLWTRRYGARMLDALPNYRREVYRIPQTTADSVGS